ncbi:hypothetical protein BKA62DRAFT_451650 [Auriculariales sp. MPI-PUGE-AT-0066]|nr:hypothetical protein BKA62DRAFT_451650 [Auriculariales sp. MPI-PUGE-AT-0066]
MSYQHQNQQEHDPASGRGTYFPHQPSPSNINNSGIGAQPPPAVNNDRSHGRSRSLLSGLRRDSAPQSPQQQQHQQQQQQYQRAANTFSGRPSSSHLGAVPEDGIMRQQQPPPPPSTQQQQQQQQHGQLQRQTSLRQPEAQPAGQLHPEIRSVVALVNAHAHKVYFSGPLIERKERLADGQRNFKDESWNDVWAQLGGTTLSIWDMRAIEAASKEGREVPPTYINIQDAFVQVIGSVTVPAQGDAPPKRYTDVLTLTTAGSNLFLFSCPDPQSLVSWASALRLAAWEKSRLEEIYTAHLLRMSLSENGQWKDPKPTLVKGRLEGWAKVRVAGQTDWRRLWMVVTAGYTADRPSSPLAPPKKNRMSALFARSSSPPPPDAEHLRPTIVFFAGNKGRERKQQILSMTSVSQVFAVYPERPEMIPLSTLMKLEGILGSEDHAMGMKGREAWLLIMPESPDSASTSSVSALEMLKWIVAAHDVFGLYGRPTGYTWDPREPHSLMFAYPVGPLRDHLFLDRELAEGLDPRDDRTSFIRSQLLGVQVRRMRGLPVQIGQNPEQLLPSPGTSVIQPQPQQQQQQQQNGGAPMLPPLSGISSEQPQPPSSTSLSSSQNPTPSRGSPQLPPLGFITEPTPSPQAPPQTHTQNQNQTKTDSHHPQAAHHRRGTIVSAVYRTTNRRARPIRLRIHRVRCSRRLCLRPSPPVLVLLVMAGYRHDLFRRAARRMRVRSRVCRVRLRLRVCAPVR